MRVRYLSKLCPQLFVFLFLALDSALKAFPQIMFISMIGRMNDIQTAPDNITSPQRHPHTFLVHALW